MPKVTKPKARKTVATLKHDADKRKNIPTAELQSVIDEQAQAPKTVKYPRNTDLDPQLVWRGKDEQDWSDLVVQAPPLYIQEKVHPKVLIDDLLRITKEGAPPPDAEQLNMWADFNGIAEGAEKTEFYQHDQNWSNRMILGDSLQVMASLAEREGLRGKVQCIYLDPPYGIKFNSNFQWSTTDKSGTGTDSAEKISREPEQVRAFRDTWRDGIHSYLTYLRDRFTVARDLLHDSGSIFVQIGDENVHRVRALLDEVFGESNFVAQIYFITTSGRQDDTIDRVGNYIAWFAKDRSRIKYRELYFEKQESTLESASDLQSQGIRSTGSYEVLAYGKKYTPLVGNHWKATQDGVRRLIAADRVKAMKNVIRYRRYSDDFRVSAIGDVWTDTGGGAGQDKIYVVQTGVRVPTRCLLMATGPGDLVLDPTCGAGTTAYVAEQWGRRWITIDTSRVALALARTRIMGARYPFYLLADSRDGQLKEAEVTQAAPSSQPVRGDIRHDFVYERVPHIKLSSISNNVEIDVIWDKWQEQLEPLRKALNIALKRQWQDWEIPREAEDAWSAAARTLHADWWEARTARQKEIDASIAAKAESEYLYDKPYTDNKKVRVAGPFTVESLSPHRMLGVDENDELIDTLRDERGEYNVRQTFPQMILDNLKTAGVQQAHKDDRITFTALTPWPGDGLICAVGAYMEGDAEKRAAIFIGPEFGTVQRADLVAAAREAGDAGFDVLIACAFNYEAHTTEFTKLGRLPVLKARMNADLHMADDLKNTGKGNLFVIFGEPDIEVASGLWLVTSSGRLVCDYEHGQELSGLGGLAEINRLGGTDLPRLKELSARGALRAEQSGAAGRGVGRIEHRGGSGPDGDGGVSAEPERGQRLPGGSGDAADDGASAGNAGARNTRSAAAPVGGDQQDAGWAQAVSRRKTLLTASHKALAALSAADFPLSLTTSHYAQITVHGVDVFKPQTGEVISDGADGIACWFIDTDYNEESFFVRHAYFLGANDPYSALKTTLKAEIDQDAWETLHSDTSRPFEKPSSGRIAVKVINHLGDEVMKVFRV